MNDFKNLGITIDTLRELLRAHDNRHIVGLIGELSVLYKLKKENQNPKHIGGTDSYDIECNEKMIEVKTSSCRSQKDGSKVWGWDLRRSLQEESKCSHFVCVQLGDNLEVHKYLIIRSEDVKYFPKSKIKNDLIISDKKSKFKKYQDAITNHVTWIDKSEQLSAALGLTVGC